YEPGNWGAVKGQELSWLESVLAKMKDEEVFIFVHHPVYSVLNPDCITNGSKHVAFSSKKNQDYIRELFKKFNVDGVFHGHEHLFNKQNIDGTEYIITGCSGAYPYVLQEKGGFYHFLRIDVKKESWICNVLDSHGNLVEQEEISFN
ncbi:MAG: metallophosphoesterase, partial [Candidatus Atribacteria bacterium]|nr:metallophosphoesterase [Candidatus Atribacteria bacterium]